MSDKKGKQPSGWRLGSELVFLWMGSACFLAIILWRPPAEGTTPSLGDLATIFFGASSLALIVFSLVIAIAAVIEWHSLKGDVEKVIGAAESAQEASTRALADNKERTDLLVETMQRKIKTLEDQVEARVQEMRGRTYTMIGFALGTIHSDPFLEEQEESDKDYLREAIHSCEHGYEILKGLEGTAKYVALINIVYNSCLLNVPDKDGSLLGYAREILHVAQKTPNSEWAVPYLTTFCRAVLAYSSEAADLRQANEVLQGLIAGKLLTPLQRKEAAMLAAAIGLRL